MRTDLKELIVQAMQMPAVDRAAFAQVLLESLSPAAGVNDAFEQEIEQRVSDMEGGITKLIPIEEAMARVRANLK